jgi:hypothetical protein
LLPDASFCKDIQEEEIVKDDERKSSIKKAGFFLKRIQLNVKCNEKLPMYIPLLLPTLPIDQSNSKYISN